MTDPLFFAYSKRTLQEAGEEYATNTCECGAVLKAGDWPFCSGHTPQNEFRKRVDEGVRYNVKHFKADTED